MSLKKVQSLVVISVLTIVLFSCEKNEDTEPVKNTHRITEIINHYSYGQMSKDVFSYDGDRLIRKTSLSQDDTDVFAEARKVEYEYESNSISSTCFAMEDETWIESSRVIYTYEDDMLTEMTFINKVDDLWLNDQRNVFVYSGSDLVAVNSYDYRSTDETFYLSHIAEYIYENKILSEVVRYKVDESDIRTPWYKQMFSFSGDKLLGWNSLITSTNEVNWRDMEKAELSYENEKIVGSDIYEWDSELDNWSITPYEIIYSYNDYGYLESETLSSDHSSIEYLYEQGHGNARVFEYLPGELICNFPGIR